MSLVRKIEIVRIPQNITVTDKVSNRNIPRVSKNSPVSSLKKKRRKKELWKKDPKVTPPKVAPSSKFSSFSPTWRKISRRIPEKNPNRIAHSKMGSVFSRFPLYILKNILTKNPKSIVEIPPAKKKNFFMKKIFSF